MFMFFKVADTIHMFQCNLEKGCVLSHGFALVYSWSDDCSGPQNPRLTYHDSVPVYSLRRNWNQSYCSGVCLCVHIERNTNKAVGHYCT